MPESDQNEPLVHVYARVAEKVTRDTGVDVSPDTVRHIHHNDTMLNVPSPEVCEAIHAELEEYSV